MFVHDIIKIKYIREGHLPDVPYRMISDKEMIDAFMSGETDSDGVITLANQCYFALNYPLIDNAIAEPYNNLVSDIMSNLNSYIKDGVSIPDWIYSYMLGVVISVNSEDKNIEYLHTLLNLSGDGAAEFDLEMAESCLAVSEDWLKKASSKYAGRAPAVFGEPHIIKSLRLSQVNVIDN